MRKPPSFCCLVVAAFTVLPASPNSFMDSAQHQLYIGDKISTLRQYLTAFPQDPSAGKVRDQLVELLTESNRYEEALQLYGDSRQSSGLGAAVDFKLLDYQLKTGRYADVLRATDFSAPATRDFIRDQRLLELRVQAWLARGRYDRTLSEVNQWLTLYAKDGVEGGRFESDVKSIHFLSRHLATLVRMQGPQGKPIFTAAVPDSLQHWSQRRDVPIVFFKLIPAHAGGQLSEPMLPGRYEEDSFFESRVDEMNKGFEYVSGGLFSLRFAGLHTLYVKNGDIDPASAGGHLLTSRVYMQTIPDLNRLAGQAFVVLVDYRAQAEDEAAYVGDGLIHISASKFQTMIVMHEALHGLGATHQEWNPLENQGYRFDPEDRGLMTFEKGEIRYLGLEEKNRVLLGWPRVAVIRLPDSSDLSRINAQQSELASQRILSSAASPTLQAAVPAQATPEVHDVPHAPHQDLSRLPI